MSKTVSFEVPDEIYQAIQAMALSTGKSVTELVLEYLTKYEPKPRAHLTEAERLAAWERLRRHMGSASSGDPRSADNDRIDTDLAREYGNNHEEGS